MRGVTIGAQFLPNVPWAWKSFWAHPMVLLTLVMRKLVSVRLEIVLISTQDRCTVCAECTTGKEIALNTPDRTPR
jgi:hypothetical protein